MSAAATDKLTPAAPKAGYIDSESLRTLPQVARSMFRFAAPRMLAAQVLVALAARPFFGAPDFVDLAIATAIIVGWPFLEWYVHRRILHINPNDPWQRRFDTPFAKCHRMHHRDPRDVELILLPPWLVRFTIPSNWLLWLLLADTTGHALTGLLALGVMNLLYEWTHMLVHCAYKPRSEFARRVRRNHRLHHYRNENHWLGFVLPLVDRMLGTAPDARDVKFSKTARDLHGLHDAGLE